VLVLAQQGLNSLADAGTTTSFNQISFKINAVEWQGRSAGEWAEAGP